MRKQSVAIYCLLLPLLLSGVRNVSAAEYAADFLYLGVGAQAAGMGGAWATAATGAENCYWNAAVDYNTPGGLMAEQAMQFGGLSNWQAVFGKLPIGHSTGISAGFIYNHVADLIRTDPVPNHNASVDSLRVSFPGDPGYKYLGNFDASSSAVIVNVARSSNFSLLLRTGLIPTRLPAAIHYGLNLKFISETIDGFNGSALAGDFGFRLIVNGPTVNKVQSRTRVILVLNIQNAFSGDQTWDTPDNTAEQLHRNYRMGIAWHADYDMSLSSIRVALERDTYGDDNFHTGLAVELLNTVSLRVGGSGTRLFHPDPTFGAGIRYRNLQADYAFVLHSELDATHRVSLAYAL
jgi:hypothetical protein